MGLSNCIECGKLFVKSNENLCRDCLTKREIDLEKIREWINLRDEPRLESIEKDTEVDEKTFRKYLIEGRLRAFSKVIARCDVCNNETHLKTRNIICENCKTSLQNAQPLKNKRELEDTDLYSKSDLKNFKKKW
jgi:NMD protein affecting ribosome stability and mRNA decay